MAFSSKLVKWFFIVNNDSSLMKYVRNHIHPKSFFHILSLWIPDDEYESGPWLVLMNALHSAMSGVGGQFLSSVIALNQYKNTSIWLIIIGKCHEVPCPWVFRLTTFSGPNMQASKQFYIFRTFVDLSVFVFNTPVYLSTRNINYML
jgi:hypothetical protein